jgi:hypothetical protein
MADPVSGQEKRWNTDGGAPAKKEKKAARKKEKAERKKAREAKKGSPSLESSE